MKQCKVCKREIADNYEYCWECVKKVPKQDDTLKVLTQINWNLGTISKQQRLYYLFNILTTSNVIGEQEAFDTAKKIFSYFSQDLDKDLKQLRQIKEEQEK